MSSKTHVLSKIVPEIIFPILIAAIGVYVFADSFNYQFETRAFAMVSSIFLVVLSVALLIRETARGKKLWNTTSDGPKAEKEIEIVPLVIAIVWCAGFFLGMLLIGFMYIVPLWVFAFLIWSKASRITLIAMPIVLWAIMKFGLVYSLGPVFFEGILFGGRLPTFW